MEHHAIINALGGPAKFAAALGCNHAQPVRWKQTGIPAWRWRSVEALAMAAGRADITVSVLAAGAPERSKPPAAPAEVA